MNESKADSCEKQIIAEEKIDSWITPGNLILEFEFPNREIEMVESDFYMWSPNQSFYWQ